MTHDRMQPEVHFRMVERGFILSVQSHPGTMVTEYAFDRIEDVARWFVDQYRQPLSEEDELFKQQLLRAGGLER